ncbi:hypothetical protein AVEN_55266-1 [Araneus ventricosus]|uniref:Uncharacterized protein n=1 Tax=Araneus ventricosus TaxID=182803 RepID=A0A4Y2D6S1_ARAVE|nr:hypothetical protein AVEN_55266-1 [Araneus ventricosus]
MAVITRCSIAGSTEVQAACRLATKSICVVTTSRYTNSLRWPHRKKSNGVRSVERGGHRTEPPRPRRSDNTNGLSCLSKIHKQKARRLAISKDRTLLAQRGYHLFGGLLEE